MPAQRIGAVLAAAPELSALSRQAQRLSQLEQTLAEALPAPLSSAARIRNLRAGTLCLAAGNAALAAKLRQLAPRLLLHLRKRGFEITEIAVRVQVALQQGGPVRRPQKRALSVDTVEQFAALAERLPACTLKAAVQRLVQRRKGS